MRAIPMQIKKWQPISRQVLDRRNDGGVEAKIYTLAGVVKVFTWPGDERHGAFTTLEMWIDPYVFHARLPNHYHERWLGRLARNFSQQCHRERP